MVQGTAVQVSRVAQVWLLYGGWPARHINVYHAGAVRQAAMFKPLCALALAQALGTGTVRTGKFTVLYYTTSYPCYCGHWYGAPGAVLPARRHSPALRRDCFAICAAIARIC